MRQEKIIQEKEKIRENARQRRREAEIKENIF